MDDRRNHIEKALTDLMDRQNLRTKVELRFKVLFSTVPSKYTSLSLANLAASTSYEELDGWLTKAAQQEIPAYQALKFVKGLARNWKPQAPEFDD